MCAKNAPDVMSPNMATLSDEESITWESSTRAECFPKSTVSINLTNIISNHGDLSNRAITAITKLSDCMIQQHKAVIKSHEDKADLRLKAWKRLPKLQKNVILLGGIDNDLQVPDSPTKEMYSIMGCQNGAQVEEYLQQSMQE